MAAAAMSRARRSSDAARSIISRQSRQSDPDEIESFLERGGEDGAGEDGAGDPVPNTKQPLGANTYDGVLFAVLRVADPDELHQDTPMLLWASAAVTAILCVFTIALQLGVMFLIWVYVIERAEDPLEDRLAERIAMLRNALATGVALDGKDPFSSGTMLLCWNDHSVRWTKSALIFVWIARISQDIKEAFWCSYACFKLEEADEGIVMLKDKDQILITQVAPWYKYFALVVVNLPRMGMALGLCFLGAKFLMMAKTLGVLIMKSVGMIFILTFDDIVFAGLASEHLKSEVTKCSFYYYVDKPTAHWNLWASVVIRLILILGSVLVFTQLCYGSLTEFRHTCNQYESKFRKVPVYHIEWENDTCTTCGFSFMGHVFRS